MASLLALRRTPPHRRFPALRSASEGQRPRSTCFNRGLAIPAAPSVHRPPSSLPIARLPATRVKGALRHVRAIGFADPDPAVTYPDRGSSEETASKCRHMAGLRAKAACRIDMSRRLMSKMTRMTGEEVSDGMRRCPRGRPIRQLASDVAAQYALITGEQMIFL